MNTAVRKMKRAFDRVVPPRHDRETFRRILAVVPFFYYFLLFVAFLKLEGLSHTISRSHETFDPRWPLFWTEGIPFESVTVTVLVGFVLAAFVGAAWHRYPLARFAAFAGLLQYHAYASSFGAPHHQWDLWLWVAFIFLFFPRLPHLSGATLEVEQEEDFRKKTALVFWGAQIFVLMTYTMAGINKIATGIAQFSAGEANVFAPDAAALHVATMSITTHLPAPFSELIFAAPMVGWVLLLGVVYLQTVSIVIAYRPSIHRLWGALLILFQIGTHLVMWAVFVTHVPLLALLLLASPFQLAPARWRHVLYNLPIIGYIARRIAPASFSTAQ